jgi:hypothetical protein
MVVMNKRRENVIDAYYEIKKKKNPKIIFQTHLFGKKFWYKHSIVTER